MKADRRSGAALSGGAGVLGRRPGRGRLATVRADFFLDPSERLSERERALMNAMLRCLVADIMERLCAEFPVDFGGADPDLVDDLNRAGLLDEPELIALLLRRAEEDRIAAAAAARAGRSEARVLQGLVGHENGAVSAAAMALILARGRRRDRFGQCLLAFDDLPASLAELLVHRVAAAVSVRRLIPDKLIINSSSALIAAHEPEKSIEALSGTLAAALAEADILDDSLLLASAHEGDVALLAHLLACRAAIRGAVSEAELLSGNVESVVMLFRMARTARSVVAGIMAAIGDLLGVQDPAAALASFAAIGDAEVEEAHLLLTSNPNYRAALGLLEANNG